MATVVLYIATSLDGFIARKDGSVDWLFSDDDYGYSEFLKSIDCLMMGRKTYEQILTFGPWPYSGKRCYVFTSQGLKADQDEISFVTGNPKIVIGEIEETAADKVWLVGGAELTAAFLRQRLIDEYILSVHPLILGEGVPLFIPPNPEEELKLMGVRHYPSGLLQVHYKRKDQSCVAIMTG